MNNYQHGFVDINVDAMESGEQEKKKVLTSQVYQQQQNTISSPAEDIYIIEDDPFSTMYTNFYDNEEGKTKQNSWWRWQGSDLNLITFPKSSRK